MAGWIRSDRVSYSLYCPMGQWTDFLFVSGEAVLLWQPTFHIEDAGPLIYSSKSPADGCLRKSWHPIQTMKRESCRISFEIESGGHFEGLAGTSGGTSDGAVNVSSGDPVVAVTATAASITSLRVSRSAL